MERILLHSYALLASRIILGIVFLWAAIIKIADPPGFASDIHNYRLLPIWSENIVALLLPWVELLVGLSLVTGYYIKGGALLSMVMMVVFTLALITAMARGLDISCGCFGHTDPEDANLWLDMIRDIALTALSAHILWFGTPSTFGH